MPGPIDERTPPMTPQLALRVAMIGGIALLLFAIIFFRLWFLQVLSGTRYVAEAQSNVVAYEPVAAARGEIVDSSGTPLVQSVAVPSIQIAPRSLRPVPVTLDTSANPPVTIPAADYPLLNRLSKLIGMSTRPRACKYTVYWSHRLPSNYDVPLAPIACLIAKSVSQSSYANVAVKTNVPAYLQDYIAERPKEFPGVRYQDTYIRKYALGTAGAQLFGTYGPITPAEVNTKPYEGIEAGNLVGQSGLEAEYNWALQGVNGEQGVKVNSQGQFEGYAKETTPKTGDTLRLSLHPKLEKVGQTALQHSIEINGGTGGAFVAMNPDNGQVYAAGSEPSYEPSSVSPTISNKELAFLDNPKNNQPLLDRATQGFGPDGSTFKVITATAALESGDWAVGDSYDNNVSWCFPGTTDCLHNSDNESFGSVDLVTAIQDSVDTFFYELGYLLNTKPTVVADHPNGGALQQWARRFGLGQKTGIDLPGEQTGQVPDPALLAYRLKLEKECDSATGPYAYTDPATGQISSKKLPGYRRSKKFAFGQCAISNASSEVWTEGDNVNTGVGQGLDQVTPIQLAVVYAAIANGGKIVTPHLGEDIETSTGQIVQKIDPAAKRKLNISSTYLDAIREGLHLATTAGTSADVMGSFPKAVYGKTGTAQYGNDVDDAWYACYVPASETSKPIVIVTWVEKGGYGDVAAAPIARQMLNQWFYGKAGTYAAGTNTTL